MNRKFKILPSDVVKSLVEFLDEVQFDAAKHEDDKDAMHKINFCNWAIQELLNSHDGIVKGSIKGKSPKKKTRDDYIEETFLDWNLPDMTEEEFEKMVDNFDNFLRAWEKEYLKDNPQKKPKKKRPSIRDIAQHCSLDEIRDMLLDDPELTPKDRFDLYYEEHKRVNKKKVKTFTLDELCKKLKIDLPPGKEKN